MRKTILAFASVLIMLAVGAVVVADSGESDAYDSIPAPEKPGVDGYPITVFKQDGTKQGYNSLNDVPVESGSEIWIYENIVVSSDYVIDDGSEMTLHLHYCYVELAYRVTIKVLHGTLNVEGTGFMDRDDTRGVGIFYMMGSSTGASDYSILNVGSGIELGGPYSVSIHNNNNSGCSSGVVINFSGTAKADYAAMSINGTVINTTNSPIVNILPGAVLEGGGTGIYAAGRAIWNIDGASITGDTGIEIRAGVLNLSNSTVTGTGTPVSVTPNGNGSTTDGAGIAIAQHTTQQPISVTIDSSYVYGFSALYESNPQDNPPESIELIDLAINSGFFETINGGTVSVYSEDLEDFIYGGTFSSDVSAYVATGKTISNIDGKYCVGTAVPPTSSGTIESEEDSIIAEVGSSSQAVVNLPSATISINGNNSIGNIMVSAQEKTFAQAPDAIRSYEITIVASTTYTANITVAADIPYGHVALAYYINDDGELVPVEVVGFTSSTVTFRTTHTTPFVIMSELGTVTPPSVDEDDDYPFSPGHGSNQGSTTTTTKDSTDDTTKIIAAAAAVVVIMLAAVTLMTNRNN